MSVSFGVAALGAFVSVILTGLLVSRSTRTPRADLAALVCAAVGLTAALVAQAAGYHGGFGALTFRTIQIGGQLLAPLGLAWSLAEMAGKSLAARFVARLGLAAVGVVTGVILAIDPLSGTAFSTSWPSAAVYYQTPAHSVLYAAAGVTVLASLLALVTSGTRARSDPGWRAIFGVVVPAAIAALATIGLEVQQLPAQSAYAAICLVAAVLTWFAGKRASELPLDELKAQAEPIWDGRESGYGPMGYNTGYNLYNDDTGEFRRGDTDFAGWYRPGDGGFDSRGANGGRYGGDTDLGPDGFEPNAANGRGGFEAGDVIPAPEALPPPAEQSAADPEDLSKLYGQIAIYTLLEEQVDEFDRLAEGVVDNVRAREPDTLVYVMHAVPSAPMQRILYEVYRDESAFERHNQQHHVQEFEEERKPYVLATNVIQLGVRHAMFAPGFDGLPTASTAPRVLSTPASAGAGRLGASARSAASAGTARPPRLELPAGGGSSSADAPAQQGSLAPRRSAAAADQQGGASSGPYRRSSGGFYESGTSGGAYQSSSEGSYPGGSAGGSYQGEAPGRSPQAGPSRGSSLGGSPGGPYQGLSEGSYPGGSAGGSYQGEAPGGQYKGSSEGSYPDSTSGGTYRDSPGGAYHRSPGSAYQDSVGDSYQGPPGSAYQDSPAGSYQGGSSSSRRGGSSDGAYQSGAYGSRPGGQPPGGGYAGGGSYQGRSAGPRDGAPRQGADPAISAYPGPYPGDTAGADHAAGSSGASASGQDSVPGWPDQPPASTQRKRGDEDERPWEGRRWPRSR